MKAYFLFNIAVKSLRRSTSRKSASAQRPVNECINYPVRAAEIGPMHRMILSCFGLY